VNRSAYRGRQRQRHGDRSQYPSCLAARLVTAEMPAAWSATCPCIRWPRPCKSSMRPIGYADRRATAAKRESALHACASRLRIRLRDAVCIIENISIPAPSSSVVGPKATGRRLVALDSHSITRFARSRRVQPAHPALRTPGGQHHSRRAVLPIYDLLSPSDSRCLQQDRRAKPTWQT